MLSLIRKYTLATPNYGYEKRQKELAKKRKKEDKLKSKADKGKHGDTDDATGQDQSGEPGTPPPTDGTPSPA